MNGGLPPEKSKMRTFFDKSLQIACKLRGCLLLLNRMYPPVDTRDPKAVELEARAVYRALFPKGDPSFVGNAFGWARQCFTGGYRDYLPVDALYHDFEHTLQGTLCMTWILRGRHRASGQPPLTQEMFQLGLMAILLHDTGYLKK